MNNLTALSNAIKKASEERRRHVSITVRLADEDGAVVETLTKNMKDEDVSYMLWFIEHHFDQLQYTARLLYREYSEVYMMVQKMKRGGEYGYST